MRTGTFCVIASFTFIAGLAASGCSSSSDGGSSNPSQDAGLPDAQQEAAPDGAVPDAPVEETGSDAPAEAAPDAPPDVVSEGGDGDQDDDGIPDAEDACPTEAEDLDGWEDEDGCPDPDGNDGTLPPLQDQAGVVYAVHYHTNDLRWYRVDGTAPRQEGTLDMGAVSHDAVVDELHDRLYVVHDVAKQVEIYQLGRPSGPGADTPQPVLLSTLDFDHQPYFARVNPYRERLYVLQTVPGTGGPVTEAALFVYDVSDPSAPQLVGGSPHTVPSSASWDIDPVRDLLFLYHGPASTLHGFDLHGDDVVPLPGGEIDLEALYPQDNSFAFQARNLTVDPYTNRIYAARPQGNLSELIVVRYPDDIPTGGASYGQFASMTDLSVVADPFDVDLPLDQRPHLLDAHTPVPDPETGALFLVGSSWNGTASTSLVLSMPESLDALDEGCGAFEGFGCWYRSYASASPVSYQLTDGAACADRTHKAFVGMSYDVYDETNPGMLHVFAYDDTRDLSVWLPDGGGNLATGGLTVSLACH